MELLGTIMVTPFSLVMLIRRVTFLFALLVVLKKPIVGGGGFHQCLVFKIHLITAKLINNVDFNSTIYQHHVDGFVNNFDLHDQGLSVGIRYASKIILCESC